MKRLAVVLALLAFPASAQAKELTGLDVCGASACTRITDADVLDAFIRSDDVTAPDPAGPQPSYLLRVRVRDDKGHSVVGWTSRWLPKPGILAYQDGPGIFLFSKPDPVLAGALRDAARGRAPRAARAYADPPPAEPRPTVERAGVSGDGGLPVLVWAAAGALLVAGAGVLLARR